MTCVIHCPLWRCTHRYMDTYILNSFPPQNRCIAQVMPSLRPFQRKVAYIEMANALVESLDFIPPHQRCEILWRTGTSKEPMNADNAWKRRKLLTKDIESIRDAITARASGSELDHDEAIDSYVRNLFVSLCDARTCTCTCTWMLCISAYDVLLVVLHHTLSHVLFFVPSTIHHPTGTRQDFQPGHQQAMEPSSQQCHFVLSHVLPRC